MKSININDQYHKEIKKEAILSDCTIYDVVDNILDKHYNKKRIELINGRFGRSL